MIKNHKGNSVEAFLELDMSFLALTQPFFSSSGDGMNAYMAYKVTTQVRLWLNLQGSLDLQLFINHAVGVITLIHQLCSKRANTSQHIVESHALTCSKSPLFFIRITIRMLKLY